jgi:hypothetical protein
MLDRWEGVVEVVEELTPLLVIRRATETLRVVLKLPPRHEQEIAVRLLYEPMQLERLESWTRGNDGFRLSERPLEVALCARPHVEYRLLSDHAAILPDGGPVRRWA